LFSSIDSRHAIVVEFMLVKPSMQSVRARPILLIVTRDRFPPFRVDLTELFGRWLSVRFDLDWVMRSDVGTGAALEANPGERFVVSGPSIWSWFAVQVVQAVRVARGEVDLVQVRDAALSAALFLIAARIGGAPFVYWMSYPMVEGYRHRALDRRARGGPARRLGRLVYGAAAAAALYRWILPSAAHVFVQSARMKEDVAAKGLPPDRMTAVPMGVSVQAFRHIAPAADPRLEGRKVLVYVGALDPERKPELLADALGRVATAGFDAVLVLVGETATADRRRIEQAAARTGVGDRLLFTGRLPLAEALGYVRRADVCLAPFPVWPPTYLSATPTKLVEYLAMGRPVVAGDHPDQRRVIESSGAGVIASPGCEAFAAAILGLLADPVRAEAMGARGPPWVAAHRDYAHISRTVEAVYDRLLRRSPS
jgi:glycosyltransferase involved in cell wall biosynthesis